MISANNFGMVVLLSLLMISLVSADIGSMTTSGENSVKEHVPLSQTWNAQSDSLSSYFKQYSGAIDLSLHLF